MATLSYSLVQVKNKINELLSPKDILRICKDLGYRWRNRALDPVLTIHLFVLQLLAQVSLNAMRLVSGVSFTAQALCKAKQRLPLQALTSLVQRTVPKTLQTLWKGFTVYIADGMSFMTPDTPELSRQYGKSRNQKGLSWGFPTPKLLALMDLVGGFIYKIIVMPYGRQEYVCLSQLFKALVEKALVLGDRGLTSFVHLFLLIRAGHHGCFRLPRGKVTFGRGNASHRRIKRLGKQDSLVSWKATRRPLWLSRGKWTAILGQELTLRQIAFRICRKGFPTHWAWIITTLLDPLAYPAQEVVELYTRRWEIEVCFRDLKRTLGMNKISAQSVMGARKEIVAFIILHNLIQRIRMQASKQQEVDENRISYIDALRWLLWSVPKEAMVRLIVNPRRKRRSPPRRIKTGRKRYAQLKGPRHKLSIPPFEVKI
jgi:hypothetical protein